MPEMLDNIEDSEMARMLTTWLYRIVQDDDYTEDIQDAAGRLIDNAEELRSLIELTV